MVGLKFKVAHKRPYWRKWSSEYPENESDKERIISILEGVLVRLRNNGNEYGNAALAYLEP
jgi:hypothetical protein